MEESRAVITLWIGLVLIAVQGLKLLYTPFSECKWISYGVVNLI